MEGVTVAGKSPRSRASRRHLKIKKKNVYFKYISVFREKYRYKEFRCFDTVFRKPKLLCPIAMKFSPIKLAMD